MRLIDTTTLISHEFVGDVVPSYAILSHRWGSEEVTLQDLVDGRASSKEGYTKIRGCCNQAVIDGWQYAWIDSCCIDKTSSAELSEAINSMFNWYQNSATCYVYLCDVSTGPNPRDHFKSNSQFCRSQWFKRGWTLQELLAPKDVVFYDCGWEEIGTKNWMASLLSNITHISEPHLKDQSDASVAQKMSWAAERVTTRLEDRAYSLLGLFNVNMPTIYGEGRKAFRRLQLEILSNNDDDSLFAWSETSQWITGLDYFLAEDPSQFKECGDIIVSSIDDGRPPPTVTNKGLRLEMHVQPTNLGGVSMLLMPLNCARQGSKNVALIVQVDKPAEEASVAKPALYRRLGKLFGSSTSPHVLENKRTIMFFSMGYKKASHGKASTYCEGIYIRTKSLQDHGYNLCTLQKSPMSIPRRIRFEEGRELQHLDIISPCSNIRLDFTRKVLTKLTNTQYDSFSVALQLGDDYELCCLYILLSPTAADRAGIWRLPLGTAGPTSSAAIDRVSEMLPNGNSVSVAFRKKATEGWKMIMELDIIIDDGGRLFWPDMSTLSVEKKPVFFRFGSGK